MTAIPLDVAIHLASAALELRALIDRNAVEITTMKIAAYAVYETVSPNRLPGFSA